MAEHSDRPPDDWANHVAKWTFVATVVLTVLYVGGVVAFVLLR
jgi:hypothetical protein